MSLCAAAGAAGMVDTVAAAGATAVVGAPVAVSTIKTAAGGGSVAALLSLFCLAMSALLLLPRHLALIGDPGRQPKAVGVPQSRSNIFLLTPPFRRLRRRLFQCQSRAEGAADSDDTAPGQVPGDDDESGVVGRSRSCYLCH